MQYDLVRSRRKSVAIQIRDGKVIVRAPLKMGVATIEKFLESKSSWIVRKLAESAMRDYVYSDILSGDRFTYLDKDLTVESVPTSRFSLRDNVLNIPAKYFDNGTLVKSKELFDALKRLYKREAKKYLECRLSGISAATGLKYNRFDLTSAKSKWGSCDSNNLIRLNWHLIMLNESIIDYVIVHELAHTVEHNHSARFWNTVAKFYPNFKEARSCLKSASAIIGIWC